MTTPKAPVTLDAVRASYSARKSWEELSGELPARLLYRPLSFLVSVPLARWGVRPTTVTLTGLALAVSLPIWAYALPMPTAAVVVGLLAMVVHILDCVDGNLARVQQRASAFGAFLDGVVDAVLWASLLGAMGWIVRRNGSWLAPHALEVSAATAALLFLGRRIRDEYALRFGGSSVFAAERPQALSVVDALLVALAGLENLYAPALVVCGLARVPDTLLAAAGVYTAGVFAVSTWFTVRAAMRVR